MHSPIQKKGGTLFIGIDDDGNPIGIKDPKSEMKKIADTTTNTLGLYPEIDIDETTNVISIDVSPSPTPVEYRGRYYARVGNTVQEIKGRTLERFIANKIGVPWLDCPVEGIDISQLDASAITEFRKMAHNTGFISKDNLAQTDVELLTKLKLIVENKLTRTAVLLFHPHPDEIIPGATMRISMFIDSELLYQDELSCPLIFLPGKTMDLLMTKYTKNKATYEGINRLDNKPYPEEALRECVANCIMHNDYSSRIPMMIRVWEVKR